MKHIIKVKENATDADIAKAVYDYIKINRIANVDKSKLIGNDINVIQSFFDIKIIKEIPVAPLMLQCGVCNTLFIKANGVMYKNNYGGNVRKSHVCSLDCFCEIKNILGDRIAKSGKRLNPILNI